MNVAVDNCPFYATETFVDTPSGKIAVRPYQLVVWVGLSLGGSLSRPFPAVLETGHTHNFSMREEHLRAWTDRSSEGMRRVGTIRVNERIVTLREADVALYRNVPGERDATQGAPYLLRMPQGIAIYPLRDPYGTRLPVIGLRALAINRMKLVVDGANMTVSLESD